MDCEPGATSALSSAPARLGLRDATAVVVLAALLLLGIPRVVDGDIWHCLALAREALQLGSLPLEDRFAFTPTVRPVVHHEWLWGFVLHAVSAGGPIGLQLLRAALIGTLVAVAVRTARLRGATPATLAVLAPLPAVMSWIGLTAVRAQVATLVLSAVWLWCIELDRRGGRRWCVPALVLHVVWLNVHAGFVVGMGLLAVHCAEQAWRRRPVAHLVAMLAAMALLVALNPYGAAYPAYLAHALTMSRDAIHEWGPLTSAPGWFLALYAASVVVAGSVAMRVRSSPDAPAWPGVALLAVAGALAARHLRHMPLWALVWFTQVPAWAARTPEGRALGAAWRRPPRLAEATACIVAAVLSIALVARLRPWELTVPSRIGSRRPGYPVGPVGYFADQRLRGNLLVPFTVGAYVSWHLHPAVKVSIDGRYEVAYPTHLLAEHEAFYEAAAEWRAFVDKYPVDFALVPVDAPVAPLLGRDDAWREVYADDAYLVFARTGLHAPQVDRRGELPSGRFP
jgi:hypothetical protein